MVHLSWELVAPYLQILALISTLTFFISLLLIPWYVGRLPVRHFAELLQKGPSRRRKSTSPLVIILRNILGTILILAGFLMLFLPGQGLLTILVGILCMSFPGKQIFIIYLITRPSIQKSLNWTRKKLGKPLFQWP